MRLDGDVKPKRTYRISLNITEEHGFLLEKIRLSKRADLGRMPKICEVVEMALDELSEVEPSLRCLVDSPESHAAMRRQLSN